MISRIKTKRENFAYSFLTSFILHAYIISQVNKKRDPKKSMQVFPFIKYYQEKHNKNLVISIFSVVHGLFTQSPQS